MSFIESVVGLKGDLEEEAPLWGLQVVPYCPRCGTPLSHEVAQGYRELTERSTIVPSRQRRGIFYFLAWTTTPDASLPMPSASVRSSSTVR